MLDRSPGDSASTFCGHQWRSGRQCGAGTTAIEVVSSIFLSIGFSRWIQHPVQSSAATWTLKSHTDSRHSIIADAAVRRFQCQRAYLRAHGGIRWMNSRNAILQGQRPNAGHFGALQQVDVTLRNVCPAYTQGGTFHAQDQPLTSSSHRNF
jgi:hypothetical protein